MYGGLVFVRKLGEKTILTTIMNSSDLEPMDLESGHQYLLTGVGNQLTISKAIDRDLSEVTMGQTIDGVLLEPIWQNSRGE